ncbi:hypothetical protein NPIL_528051 [Nephila pilipes]|uniref:Uncharacterized protein n=1 Tax=Nephila pilipes TaxID=299642 RepID=A0A8X6UHE2_NEPPI|nr:hypothetical protein NPIL_691231 [Nephila pilipes]GFU50175.1 hypothetical protein NPIL_528051 [Nephila pilipes]
MVLLPIEKCLIKKMESSKSSISKRRSSKDNDDREEPDVENLLEGDGSQDEMQDGSDDSQDERSIQALNIEKLIKKIRAEREKIQRENMMNPYYCAPPEPEEKWHYPRTPPDEFSRTEATSSSSGSEASTVVESFSAIHLPSTSGLASFSRRSSTAELTTSSKSRSTCVLSSSSSQLSTDAGSSTSTITSDSTCTSSEYETCASEFGSGSETDVRIRSPRPKPYEKAIRKSARFLKKEK